LSEVVKRAGAYGQHIKLFRCFVCMYVYGDTSIPNMTNKSADNRATSPNCSLRCNTSVYFYCFPGDESDPAFYSISLTRLDSLCCLFYNLDRFYEDS
jgi:hypothetical protein